MKKNKLSVVPISESQVSYLLSGFIETGNVTSIGKIRYIDHTKTNDIAAAPISES